MPKLPEAVLRAAAAWRPNLLADHVYGLANAFSTFYRDCRVIGEGGEVHASRLSLVFATARALELGLGLLGDAAQAPHLRKVLELRSESSLRGAAAIGLAMLRDRGSMSRLRRIVERTSLWQI